MKTSYELAMERLGKSAPAVKLSAEQKKALAELESVYKARVAEQELAARDDAAKAEEKGDPEGAEKARERLVAERRRLQAELEEKKERVRQGNRAA
jgi:hypothetical protein